MDISSEKCGSRIGIFGPLCGKSGDSLVFHPVVKSIRIVCSDCESKHRGMGFKNLGKTSETKSVENLTDPFVQEANLYHRLNR